MQIIKSYCNSIPISAIRQSGDFDGISDRVLEMLWKQKRAHHPSLAPSDLSKHDLVYHGSGIQPALPVATTEIQQMVQFLLGKGVSHNRSWLSARILQGIFYCKDPALLTNMRNEFKAILQACANHLPLSGTPEEKLFEAFIGNIIALIPYTYPQVGEAFIIPVKQNGVWDQHNYRVDHVFQLSPSWFSASLPAFGLVSDNGGPSLLTFLGTTFPAGDGFIATVLSDFTPLHCVGEAAFAYGEEEIAAWLQDKSGVIVNGLSLGGALALHTARKYSDKLAQVNAYNPACLYSWNWDRQFDDGLTLNIYYQENDLVATMGFLPTGNHVHIYRLFLNQMENNLLAHARAYTGAEEVTIIESTPEYENGRLERKFLTALHLVLSPLLLFMPILILYTLYKILAILGHFAIKMVHKCHNPAVLPSTQSI